MIGRVTSTMDRHQSMNTCHCLSMGMVHLRHHFTTMNTTIGQIVNMDCHPRHPMVVSNIMALNAVHHHITSMGLHHYQITNTAITKVEPIMSTALLHLYLQVTSTNHTLRRLVRAIRRVDLTKDTIDLGTMTGVGHHLQSTSTSL
jgi:hypothetical protein